MTRIKICGLTNLEDATVAAEAGADMLGFIFHEKSPRYVSRETVAAITESLRGLDIDRMPLFVGVFVSPTADDVAETLERCWLQAAQIHKTASSELTAMAKKVNAIYPAVQFDFYPPERIKTSDSRIIEFRPPPLFQKFEFEVAPWLPQLLVDTYHPNLAGGTGQRLDLSFALNISKQTERMMMAGGLNPDNVAETIRAVRPWAVDVSSGVETTPGKKDHGKVRAFIQTVREVDRQLANKEQTE